MSRTIAYFVSPHGYGHAARAAAVMAAIHEVDPTLRFEIFTTVTPALFEESAIGNYRLHSCVSDVGMVQSSAFTENIAATVDALNRFLPFSEYRLAAAAEAMKKYGCRLAVCDISPLGLAAARSAAIPSVLIENFTWDWIYAAYACRTPAFEPHIGYLRRQFRSATAHIQATPACGPTTDADLVTAPIGRKTRCSREYIRRRLNIPPTARAVLMTFGGVPHRVPVIDRLPMANDLYFVICGATDQIRFLGQAVLLPHHSGFYHPDLISACDAVIGKLGYSTIAEIYHAGIPFGYLSRRGFRESPVLEAFVRKHMNGVRMEAAWFDDDRWEECLPMLWSTSGYTPDPTDGARQAAEFILAMTGA